MVPEKNHDAEGEHILLLNALTTPQLDNISLKSNE